MSVEAIETKIVEALQSIPGIKKVHNPEPVRLDSYPAATLFFEGFAQERSGFSQHTATWRWIIRLYLLMQDERKAQTDGKQLVQHVAETLRQDITLGGVCLSSLLREGSASVVTTETSRFLMWELVFEASERL
ncbi:hypothetical protein BSNK01_28330 [Bacillaceae bacterium]